jgi:hypothetical protein
MHPTKMYYIDREQSFTDWHQQMTQKPTDLIQKILLHRNWGSCDLFLLRCDTETMRKERLHRNGALEMGTKLFVC